ncbi:alpha-2,8-polysialyltransferase family protein [Microbacterium sp. KUDC0406]|uniref:alpha-2,8-polysialyltransferase family protein n=1 Tax=Microbacterium sp. KUDC0406 TaxID=2909588 RepID=UPI001F48121D|nr:alpha-2,8-polysialyltransferase family protein [Microbacterium sp. KUDC0406]UJP11490.1 alpha-2,8-polysialyltransferase family protein [Microbacterium sp. KUDC0406]
MSTGTGDIDARTSATMRTFLDLEDRAPDVLLDVLPGMTVPFWARARMQMFWAMSAQQTGSVEVSSASEWTRAKELKRVARGFLPSGWDAVRRARPHEVCFYVAGGTLAAEDGLARNWLVDDFAAAAPDAVVVQVRPLPSALGRPVFRPTLSMEPAIARARWRARGSSLPSGFSAEMDRLFSEFARLLEVPAETFSRIGAGVVREEQQRPHQRAELERMLERMRPRIVFYDNGSYTYHGETVGLFKDAGAYVVEPQHGWIGPSHAAYNYGRAFDAPELRRTLPDEVLTFGTFWSDSIRHPGQVTAIGKPHLERQIAAASGARPQQILVVSSRAEPEKTDEFVIGLRAALGAEWSILFRPHPGERAATNSRYPRISAAAGVMIDEAPDVYESLKQSAVVIGVASTVLFEASAFGCEVIARDSAFAENVIGDAFGVRIGDASEAAARVRTLPERNTSTASSEPDIWAPNPRERFASWLDARLSGSQNGAIG